MADVPSIAVKSRPVAEVAILVWKVNVFRFGLCDAAYLLVAARANIKVFNPIIFLYLSP
jgi:hypothetical protein